MAKITAATARRAMNRLGTKLPSGGVTYGDVARGMRVEMEHRDVTGGRVGTTARIALAHLRERPDYYRRLDRYVERPQRIMPRHNPLSPNDKHAIFLALAVIGAVALAKTVL